MKHHTKSEKRTSLIVKLTVISALFLLFAIIIFSIISVRSVQSSSMETAVIMGKDKLAGDMEFFENMVFNEYGQLSLRDGKLLGQQKQQDQQEPQEQDDQQELQEPQDQQEQQKLQEQQGVSLEYQYEVVDKISSAMGIVATVFIREDDDYRRISTSIVNNSGKRATDTYLGINSAAYPSVHAGHDYIGNAVILGHDYLTCYRPIFASEHKDVIGILFIGIEMTKIGQVISQNTARQINLVVIIAIIILLGLIIVNTVSFRLILVSPIRSVTAIIGRLSMGDINQQISESKNRDEIGTMKNELKQLINGLKDTSHFAQSIGKGDFHAEYQLLSNDDVLGNSLLEMRQSLQDAEKIQAMHANNEKQLNWSNEGLATFAELLRSSNDNLEELCNSIISNMVKYIGANQGGIFILNDESSDHPILEMKACYAYERHKFAEKEIELGEGLVGTCFLERQTIYMTELPKNYINITSGLGGEVPNALLITPLMVNEEIYGVIEIAAFKVFEPHVREFVGKVAESIASSVSSTKTAIRTQRLLEQSKLQAEEMANQEEELRQNMEEMQATQEEMLRKNKEAEQVRIKLTKLMSENEYQLTKLTMVLEASKIGLWDMEVVKGDPVNPDNTFQWSDEFRHMLGYSNEADFPNILSSWSDKLHPKDKERTLDLFARHILDRSGKIPYDLEYRALKKNGKYSYFHAYGSTIRDKEGHALRVAGAIQDITEEKNKVEEMARKENEQAQFVKMAYDKTLSLEFDDHRKIIFASPYFLEAMNMPSEQVIGATFNDFITETHDYNGQSYDEMWEAIYNGEVCSAILNMPQSDGSFKQMHVAYSPISDQDGKIYKVMSMGTML